jgi:hypothetical protein
MIKDPTNVAMPSKISLSELLKIQKGGVISILKDSLLGTQHKNDPNH